MASKTIHQIVKVSLLLFALAVLPAFADEVWDYPKPDAGCDVKDISFYKAPEDQGVLTNITAGCPRNVIFLIGDGMGVNHVTLARHRAVGASGRLHMERLPVTGLVRTHSASSAITDSAAAATALACGIKTDNGRIGTAPDGTAWMTILEKARLKSFRTGLVSTSAITHATPAGFAAHVKSRGSQAEIAAQMLNARVDILLGGGRKYWQNKPNGNQKDGRALINEAKAAGYQVVYSRDKLAGLTPGRVLGLFAEDGMTTYAPEPSLAEMTDVVINLLSKKSPEWFAPDPRFFVMIEGSQIDWAGHANDTDNTIRQMLLFDMAVKEAIDFARRDKRTLVIVTSDHETGGLLLKTKDEKIIADWQSKNHTAADVPLYAFGPGSTCFVGIHDNIDIPKLIAGLLKFDNFPTPLRVKTAVEASAR